MLSENVYNMSFFRAKKRRAELCISTCDILSDASNLRYHIDDLKNIFWDAYQLDKELRQYS